MSRTRRIYNKKVWKRRALRHYKAKYDNPRFYGISLYDMSPEEMLEKRYVVWAGPYCYHPYKQLCMGNCSMCKSGKLQDNRKKRRKLRDIERNWERY